jgi:hypothetical protein
MSRFFTTRRSEWLPGLAVLVFALVIGGTVGGALGSQSWPVYVGLFALALLAIGAVERYVSGHKAKAATPRARGRLRVLPGSNAAPYDLAKDERTNGQRYLM